MTTHIEITDPTISTKRAIEAAGNKSRLAKLLGIARSSVQAWGEFVPKTQVYRVARVFPHLVDGCDSMSANEQTENRGLHLWPPK